MNRVPNADHNSRSEGAFGHFFNARKDRKIATANHNEPKRATGMPKISE